MVKKPLTEPHAAGEVEEGWVLWFRDHRCIVGGKKFSPPKDGEIDRQVTIAVTQEGDGARWTISGDEGQTVYRVIGSVAQA